MRTGTLLGMGKGFACSSSILGQDLGVALEQACKRRVSDFAETDIHSDIDIWTETQRPNRGNLE